MKAERSVILMEFNELSPSLMRRFMHAGKLPNFQRLYDESHVYTTDAQEQPPNLNPWIQWVTVHSGLPFAEHKIFHLGDGHKLSKQCVWDVVNAAGMKSWVCGAMNMRYDRPARGWVLPDPWTVGAHPEPETLNPYFKFVQRHVQEYTNDHVPLTAADYYRFVAFMATHGLSLSTLTAIARQLVSERFGQTQWRRAALLDKLQFDVFRWYFRKACPALSIFFVNSTAHFQHMYWREMEPEHFTVKPSADELRRYETAILYGYQQMDGLVGRFLRLAGSDATLIFATALSQQPCLAYEAQGGKAFYRPRDFDRLLSFVGVGSAYRVSPVMSEEFHVHFERESDARQGMERLNVLTLNGEPVMALELKGNAVFAGCRIFRALAQDALLVNGHGESAPFFDVFYQVDGIKSGMHHPDGLLWIRRKNRIHQEYPEKVPLTAIAPTVLDLLGLKPPWHMRESVLPLNGSPAPSAAPGKVAATA